MGCHGRFGRVASWPRGTKARLFSVLAGLALFGVLLHLLTRVPIQWEWACGDHESACNAAGTMHSYKASRRARGCQRLNQSLLVLCSCKMLDAQDRL